MKKSGFTLIELLGTVLILSVIILIVAPLVVNQINKGKEETKKMSKESLELATKNWGNDNKEKLPDEKGGISIDILEKEGYVSESNNKGCVIITKKDEAYYYNYSESSECREYALVDNTPPIITLDTSSTTNSISVDVKVKEEESLVSFYNFQIDDETPILMPVKDGVCKEESCSYTFTGLTQNTSHTIKVSVTNSLNKESSGDKEVTTKLLQIPSLLQSSRYGQINYQNQCGLYGNIRCSYQKDDSLQSSVNGNTNVYFANNGILVGIITDGTNTETASLTMIVEKSASYSSPYYTCPSGYTLSGTTCRKTDTVSVTGRNVCGPDGQAASWTDNQAYYKAQGYSCTFNGCASSCSGKPEGYSYNCYATCRKTFTTSATYHRGYYYCTDSNFYVSGSKCYIR